MTGLGQSQMGTGEWRAGNNRNFGNGMGGPGIGRGGQAGSQAGNVGFQNSRIKGMITKGQILARMKIPGDQAPGEATVEYEEMRILYEQHAEDTIHTEMMPLEHKALIRDYFAAIKYAEEQKEEPEKNQGPQ